MFNCVSLKLLNCNTVTCDLNSLQYLAAYIWKHLPNEIKNPITVAEMKYQIQNMAMTKSTLHHVHKSAVGCNALYLLKYVCIIIFMFYFTMMYCNI